MTGRDSGPEIFLFAGVVLPTFSPVTGGKIPYSAGLKASVIPGQNEGKRKGRQQT